MEINLESDNEIVHIGGRKKLPPETIVHMDADINYTIVHLIDGKKIIVANTLKTMEEKLILLKNFIRVNKSTILNINHASLQGDAFVLPNQRLITFSRRRLKQFKTVNQSIL